MENSVNLARHFAQLVWLLLHEPKSIDEQKVALRAILAASREGAVSLVVLERVLTANAATVPATLTGVTDLSSQMALHGLAMISIDASSPPAHLLGVARLLAAAPAADDGGAAEAKRVEIGATSIRFAARPRPRQSVPQSRVTNTPGTAPRTSAAALLADMEFGEVLDDPLGEARAKSSPRSTLSMTVADSKSDDGLFSQFSAPRVPTASPEQLLQQLELVFDAGSIVYLLENLAILAEQAAHDGKGDVVMQIMSRVARREAEVEDFEAKRAFVMMLRRLAKPEVLRTVATRIPHHLEKREEYLAVLTRAGDDGVDALIDQVAAVEHQRDRRIYFDVLLHLKAGVPSLLHMLTDSRWFVARNAAELLGEMQITAAEEPMTALLQHEDDRVRRAATGALMRLGTPRALLSIERSLVDSAPQMRMEAAAALVTRKDFRASVGTLLKALDAEKDEEVQAALMLALGRLATPDAVQRLIQAAEAERGIFKKKTTAFRIAAVHALSEARTLEATDALRALQNDKDPEVREAAAFARGRIARGSSGGRVGAR